MEIKSLTPEIGELERAVQWCARETDIAGVPVVVSVQTRGKRANCGGWFAPLRFSTREGDLCHEINFCAEILNAPPVTIVGIGAHEVVHRWCHWLGLKDVSKSGRHNKVFKHFAGLIGLQCADPVDYRGFAYTTPTKEFAVKIEKEFRPDVSLLNLFRVESKSKPSNKKPLRYSCGCTKISSRVEVRAVCVQCDNTFEEED
jgi:hypothetical protein